MNRCDHGEESLEAPTDQLVDELCQRLSGLYALVNTSLADAGPPVDEIRQHSAHLITRLTQQPQVTARQIGCALWPPGLGVHIPAGWWSTPLGVLIGGSLDGPPPVSERADMDPALPATTAIGGVRRGEPVSSTRV